MEEESAGRISFDNALSYDDILNFDKDRTTLPLYLQSCDKFGVLKKRGDFNNKYKRRLVSIENGILRYYVINGKAPDLRDEVTLVLFSV